MKSILDDCIRYSPFLKGVRGLFIELKSALRFGRKLSVYIGLTLFLSQCTNENDGVRDVDILIIGGGASGTMAGIQAARLGSSTLIVEETPWLGGMLTSAGVSAIDGNYKLPSGLWEEFRQRLYTHYGGADSVKTGWVSHVLFEPNIGAEILKSMAGAEENLEVTFNSRLTALTKLEKGWSADFLDGTNEFTILADIVIDATELGDAAKMAGIPYDIGMDSRYDTGEEIAPEQANDIIQDLTYVAVLKDYGSGSDHTIPKPDGYDPSPFYCTCAGMCDQDSVGRTLWECNKMMQYGRLPNDRYMINWPIYGNDYYLNIIEMTHDRRQEALEKAKWFTRCYVYYLQTELGFTNLGIADDVFPTEDGFPMIPYHRESRRIHGLVRFTINDLARPFEQKSALYRTGIAVGDYPVDHHHAAYPESGSLPDLHFYPVPSYCLPLGTMIPGVAKDFIVAEKSISVTNIVNGTTRLQPVCLLIGQAAGVLAHLSEIQQLTPFKVPVRQVQEILLEYRAYIMPYIDVLPTDKAFSAVQRIGATGILKGEGKNVGWENFTFFHPDSLVTGTVFKVGLKEIMPDLDLELSDVPLTIGEVLDILHSVEEQLAAGSNFTLTDLTQALLVEIWASHSLGTVNPDRPITRRELAVLLDQTIDPFHRFSVDHHGGFLEKIPH